MIRTDGVGHAGARHAWLGGTGRAHTDILAQRVTLSRSCGRHLLSFWLHTYTSERTRSRAYDTLAVQVLDSAGRVLRTLRVWSNLSAGPGFSRQRFDLSRFRGRTITLRFTARENRSYHTSFTVDDVTLSAG